MPDSQYLHVQMERWVHCSDDEGDHNAKVNSLTLSSTMQDCYRYSTACTQQAQYSPTLLHLGTIADVSGASCSKKGDHGKDDKQLNFIKHQDCSAIATACVYSSYLSSFSLSAKVPADLSVLSGTARQYNHKWSFKAGAQFQNPVRLSIGP